MPKEKHFFVEDDIIAEKSLKGEFDDPEEELKTLKDLMAKFDKEEAPIRWEFYKELKQLAISHIKHMRREGRDGYYANIDEKSAIPKLMEIFNLIEEDVGKIKKNPLNEFL